MNANHEAICQFASEDSETYKHVSNLIVDFVHSAMAVPKNGLDKAPSLVESFESLNTTLVENDWVEVDDPGFCGCLRVFLRGCITRILTGSDITVMIPYPRNQEFVNRKPAIEKLRARLLPIGKAHSRVAIFGLGGVGFVFHSTSPKSAAND